MLHILAMSAPEYPTQSSASLSRSTSGSYGVFRSDARRIARRAGMSGSGMYTCCPSRPCRRIAGSRTSGRLVAPTMKRFPRLLTPSISVSNWFTTLSPCPAPPRFGARASSSSKKRMHGEDWTHTYHIGRGGRGGKVFCKVQGRSGLGDAIQGVEDSIGLGTVCYTPSFIGV